MTTETYEMRFRPLGRGTFVGGFFVTLLIHVGLAGLVYYSATSTLPPSEDTRDIMVTKMVTLGKPREKFWLPRIAQPPKPEAPTPTIKVTENVNAAPAVKEPPKPEDPKQSKELKRAMDRARALAANVPEEPPEGSLTGSTRGTSNVASEGDEYGTQIFEAIRKNWNVPNGLSLGEALNLEAEVRISIAEDGEILSPVLHKSSGNSLFDDTTLQAVQATHKVPPPPANQRAKWRRGGFLLFGGKDLAR